MDLNQKLIGDLLANDVKFVTSVPCKQLGGVIDAAEADAEIRHVPCNKEDEGIGLCAGAYMAGVRPAIIMQNTAIGVVVNTLVTLTQFYRMPLPMLISYRGELGEPVACQTEMAVHTKALLNQLNIPTYHFHRAADAEEFDTILKYTFMAKKPVAILTDATFWGATEMIRSELLKTLYPILEQHLVVSNIGLPSQELHQLGDRDNFFYMLGTMGLSSSIGFGLAMNQPKTVISIDGDGSVLTNLATLATIANQDADNYILFIVDNGSYGSTGDQPTYAGAKTSLAAVASACGCDHVLECDAAEGPATLQQAIDAKRKTVIVCRCESGNIKLPVIDIDPAVIRHRFMQVVAG